MFIQAILVILAVFTIFYNFAPLPSAEQPKVISSSLTWYFKNIRKIDDLVAPELSDVYTLPQQKIHIDLKNPPNYRNYPLDFSYQPIDDKRIFYFEKDGKLAQQPVKNGYFRKILGKTDSGQMVVQDFYQNTKQPQTSIFKMKPQGKLDDFSLGESEGITAHFDKKGELSTLSFVQNGQEQDSYLFENKRLVAQTYERDKAGFIVFFNQQHQIEYIVKNTDEIFSWYALYEDKQCFKYLVKMNLKDKSKSAKFIWDKQGYPRLDNQAPFSLSVIDSDLKTIQETLKVLKERLP